MVVMNQTLKCFAESNRATFH